MQNENENETKNENEDKSETKKFRGTLPQATPDVHLEGVQPEDVLPTLLLADAPESVQKACARAHWTELMPVQNRSMPYMLARRDIMVQSRTGSGKTGAYLLPMLECLDSALPAVQALVLVPTRELAIQVEQEARVLFRGTGLTVAAVYGGVGYGKQIDALRQGVSLVVGTPGRMLDHLIRRSLICDKIRSLVFDEADRMLSIGFYPDIKEIQSYLPDTVRHGALFSATYPPHVIRLARDFMNNPALLSLSTKEVHVAEVQHMYCECKAMDKDKVLLRLLEAENPTSAIIFSNTKANVHYIAAVLQNFGFNADALSSDLSQRNRESVLSRLRSGHIRFLVATDVAARGIDIPELSHVFLYEPPDDRESYIHRSGRTGRAGAAGVVISLVDIMQKMELQRIAKHFKIPLEVCPTPPESEVNKIVGTRLLAMLETRHRQLNSLERERLHRFDGLVEEMLADPDAATLLSMLLQDSYQRCLQPKQMTQPKPLPEKPIIRSGKPRFREGGRSGGGRPGGGGGGGRPGGWGGAREGGRPGGGRPGGGRPGGGRPEGGRPEGDRPASTRPEGARPKGWGGERGERFIGRPSSDRPAAARPEGDRPAAARPEGAEKTSRGKRPVPEGQRAGSETGTRPPRKKVANDKD